MLLANHYGWLQYSAVKRRLLGEKAAVCSLRERYATIRLSRDLWNSANAIL
jgi:hypothetical protein